MRAPGVASAVCIAARHPKWEGRPLFLVVKELGGTLTTAGLPAFLDSQIAK
ncbi:hypothetical protein [Paraburkholderia saeva]|uniref:hypothetical protein n=1 Tax=Paraburkholderia saeva TaxID=2777537 RepID=UPI001E5C0AF1|nr:hypothetical protein [Paraburkholderia saeva]